jgi:hypothetical protein
MVEALRDGRLAMGFASGSKFCDWGIPVLYSFDPELVIFNRSGSKKTQAWAGSYQKALHGDNVLKALADRSVANEPSIFAAGTTKFPHSGKPKKRVALVDIDSKVGFLPDLVEQANHAQRYYQFKVAYAPIPAGSFGGRKSKEKTFVMNHARKYLEGLTSDLSVDYACCLTACMIDDGRESDLFTAPLPHTTQLPILRSNADCARNSSRWG